MILSSNVSTTALFLPEIRLPVISLIDLLSMWQNNEEVDEDDGDGNV